MNNQRTEATGKHCKPFIRQRRGDEINSRHAESSSGPSSALRIENVNIIEVLTRLCAKCDIKEDGRARICNSTDETHAIPWPFYNIWDCPQPIFTHHLRTRRTPSTSEYRDSVIR
jgi:hypothetical protein